MQSPLLPWHVVTLECNGKNVYALLACVRVRVRVLVRVRVRVRVCVCACACMNASMRVPWYVMRADACRRVLMHADVSGARSTSTS